MLDRGVPADERGGVHRLIDAVLTHNRHAGNRVGGNGRGKVVIGDAGGIEFAQRFADRLGHIGMCFESLGHCVGINLGLGHKGRRHLTANRVGRLAGVGRVKLAGSHQLAVVPLLPHRDVVGIGE